MFLTADFEQGGRYGVLSGSMKPGLGYRSRVRMDETIRVRIDWVGGTWYTA